MRPVVLLISLGAIVGCNEYSISRMEREDAFAQLPASEVDILLVVDNSCSMQPYQEELSTNFESFLTYFEQGDVDYRIGVLTTTVIPVEFSQGYTCPQSELDKIPPGGELVGGTYITPETEDGADVFTELVSVGTCGNGNEMGLESANLALSGALDDDFLREDAYLSVIFVSDEEDVSPWPVNDYINQFRSVKGFENIDSFNASALVVTDPEVCTPQQIASGGTLGSRYIEMAAQNGGILGSICDDSFDRVVTELSLATSRLADTFWLSDIPDLSTLIVLIDGVETTCTDGHWSYQELEHEGVEGLPAIVFEREFMPLSGTDIVARYNAGSGGDFTCGATTAATATTSSGS